VDTRTFDAVLRTDFVAFVERAFRDYDPGTKLELENYIRLICSHLGEVAERKLLRLAVSIPPRHLKSFLISIAFPAWLLGCDPKCRIMVLSHDMVLAKELSKACRNIVKADWYQRIFPATTLSRDSDTTLHFNTEQGGGRFAASMDSGVTGHGADVIVVDDPLAANNAFSQAERERVNTVFDTMVASRLNDRRRGAIVIVAQRLHQMDLIGHVLAKGDYRHLSLPLVAEQDSTYEFEGQVWRRPAGSVLIPAMYPKETVEEIRRSLGHAAFETQYQQQPIPPGGTFVTVDDFPFFDRPPANMRIVVSCDLAQKAAGNSFSVFLVIGIAQGRFFVLDRVRARLDFVDMLKVARLKLEFWKPADVIVEEAAAGAALISQLTAEGYSMRPVRPGAASKLERFQRHLDVFKSGSVLVLKDASWATSFVGELTGFPHGTFDDQVDALTQVIQFAKENPAKPTPYLAGHGLFEASREMNLFGKPVAKGENALRPRSSKNLTHRR
jgi:predicted phage terminase large subunit-like protein